VRAMAAALALAALVCACIAPPAWVPVRTDRRDLLVGAGAVVLASSGAGPARAEFVRRGAPKTKDGSIPPGYVPPELMAKTVGTNVVTPNGLDYVMTAAGPSDEKSARNGPPKSGSVVWVKFTGHLNGFDGQVFDSTKIRNKRSGKNRDYTEAELNNDSSMTDGMFEALKLMKVGQKGRFVQPPRLSYAAGEKAMDIEDAEVKRIEPNTTLYYEVELVNIVRP